MTRIRYILENKGIGEGGHNEKLLCFTMEEVRLKARGEFSICTDLFTNEVFEPEIC